MVGLIVMNNLEKTDSGYYSINSREIEDGTVQTFEFATEESCNSFIAGVNYASYGRAEVLNISRVGGKFRVSILDRE